MDITTPITHITVARDGYTLFGQATTDGRFIFPIAGELAIFTSIPEVWDAWENTTGA